jgi:hypothetical protein
MIQRERTNAYTLAFRPHEATVEPNSKVQLKVFSPPLGRDLAELTVMVVDKALLDSIGLGTAKFKPDLGIANYAGKDAEVYSDYHYSYFTAAKTQKVEKTAEARLAGNPWALPSDWANSIDQSVETYLNHL